ncbi:hypothetical protein MAAFP003_1778, partial [Mycobacterium ahvazicum]
VNVRCASHTRRRQAAIAVIAALSLFASLIAGSALRSQFSAATLPEPAAWSHSTPNSGHPQSDSAFFAAIHLQQASSWDASPVNKKPFHSMWMTHDRPDVWTRISAHSLLSVLPVSFPGTGFRIGGVSAGTPAPECDKQEILALLCVARR